MKHGIETIKTYCVLAVEVNARNQLEVHESAELYKRIDVYC